jgi:hypothetical protein
MVHVKVASSSRTVAEQFLNGTEVVSRFQQHLVVDWLGVPSRVDQTGGSELSPGIAR